jgi:hypothetical protein
MACAIVNIRCNPNRQSNVNRKAESAYLPLHPLSLVIAFGSCVSQGPLGTEGLQKVTDEE